MTSMMVLRHVYALVVDLLMRGSLSKGWITQDSGFQETWKVSDYMEGGDRVSRGTV